MKILFSLVAGFLFVQSAQANMKCLTSDGIEFSIVEDYNRDADCEVNTIVIGGKKIGSESRNGCGDLKSFTGTDGSKIALVANGLGTYGYSMGKVVAVNCNPEKK